MLKSLSIGSLQVHSNTSTPNGCWIQPDGLDGFDSPDYRVNEYEKTGAHGTNVSSILAGQRLVSLPIMIEGSTPAEYASRRRALADACLPQYDSYGMPTPTRITFTTLDDEDYFFDAYFRKPTYPIQNNNFALCMVQCSVKDSYFYKATETVSAQIAPQTTVGGFLSPFISPFITDTVTGTPTTINNGSALAVRPIIELTGILTSPYILNVTTGDYLYLDNYLLQSGYEATIDNANYTIKENDSLSLLSYKTTDSKWLTLEPGNNSIQLLTESTADDGYAVVRYYEVVQGI